MRKYSEQTLKGACVLLAGLLAVQLIQLLRGGEEIGNLRVPDIHYDDPKPASGPTPKQGMPNIDNPPTEIVSGLPEGVTIPAGVSLPPGVELPPGVQLPPGVSIRMPGRAMPVISRGGSMPLGATGPALEPEVQARVDAVIKAELFGAVPKPPPMALMGIAGNYALLRSPAGQEGLIAVGEELGGVTLLKIGTNRVVVEHEGQEKELTLFGGYGSESLLKK